MTKKIAIISKNFRDKKWELYYKRVNLARKIRASNFKITQKIRRGYYKFIRSIKNKPNHFVLVKRFFVGFGYGIYYGIKDAYNSWKYDRGKINDYNIEIPSLPFHGR